MKKIKILSIDDDSEIRYAITQVIESQGWESITACNVSEALTILEDIEPTIIIIDYHMPDMNGLEGVKRIRKIIKDAPIIVLTIEEDFEVSKKFLENGADDFANKPVRAADLISRINLHLKMIESSHLNMIDLKNIELDKGIGKNTLNLIIENLKDEPNYLTADEIIKKTGLSPQTTYRYLQFLEEKDLIDTEQSYGGIGRPKTRYKLK